MPAKLTFTQEMRAKAMSLHTFSQAPKEGKKKDTKETQVVNWETTKEDFLQFLTDSLVVYKVRTALGRRDRDCSMDLIFMESLLTVKLQAFELAVQKPGLELLVNSGLERVDSLQKDIAFIESTYGLAAPAPSAAATEYADFLKNIKEDGVFVVHFYNYYFAHTAGGRMIGQKVMDEVFGGHLFEFYKWDRDVKEILAEVKGHIDVIANTWTREQKDASLAATPETFQKSGALLRALVGKARDRAARMMNKVQKRKGLLTKVPQSQYSVRKAAWDV